MKSPAAVINQLIDRRLATLHGPMPARVTDYDPVTQSVSLQPLVQRVIELEDGSRSTETLPQIHDVPVMFPGSGEYRITWPVAVGDIMLLIPAGVAIDQWLVRGGTVDPGTDRAHALTDAVALPGLFSFARVPTDAPLDAVVMHGDVVQLGSPAANDPVARRSDLDQVVVKLNALIAAYTAHVHASLGSPPGGAPVTVMVTPPCSDVVRVP